MPPASATTIHQLDAHTALVPLSGMRAEVSSPVDGILRLLVRRNDTHGANLALAVQKGGGPRSVRVEGDRVEAERIALSLSSTGTLEIQAVDADGALSPIFSIESFGLRADGRLGVRMHVGSDDPFFGMGELTGSMNRRNRRCENWNLDFAPHTPSTPSFYTSFPVYMSRALDAHDRSVWYGVFLDNAGRSVFEFGIESAERASIEVRTGHLDIYLMAGPTPAEVLRRYCVLTGTMEMPPRWMLGYQQSRWSYMSAARVREVAAEFRRLKFPCDVLYLDIDYMDRFRAFTWNSTTFPDPAALVADLHAQGFKVVPILNSAVAVDADFEIYRDGHARGHFIERADGSEYHDNMWPGQSAFPDFARADVRSWWGDLHADLLDLEVDGLWNDMNEPTILGDRKSMTFPNDLVHQVDGEQRAHEEIHNAYGMLMDVATHEGLRRLRPHRRIPLLTRSAYAGVQRFAFLWTGDNSAWWEHLRLAIAQVCNLGLCGVPFSGPDVGGFHDDASGELFLRWLQMGVFFPYLRAHSARETKDAEPWVFGEEVLAHGRRFVELRYALLDYIYSLAATAARHGDPIMRPLFYEFPQDLSCEAADDQFMLGPDILVAPILAPGRFYRAVNLPPGAWYSFFGETLFEGAAIVVAESPLEHIPVYVRAGAIIPMRDAVQYVGERADGTVRWHVWSPPSRGQGSGWLYEDDGLTDGQARARQGYCETHVHATFADDRLRLVFEPRQGTFDPGSRRFEVVLHGKRRLPRTCSADGVAMRDGLIRLGFEDSGQAREIDMTW